MITNSELTIYHKTTVNHEDIWVRYNYSYAWVFGGKGSSRNKGYENANDINIRIPYELNSDLDINKFSIGDIIVKGNIEIDIDTKQDLSSYNVYEITSITNNTYGNSKHIHLGGK